ncbi:MAG: glycosyltransferase family 4 protein, partial [Terracidiphilus sp.]
TLSVSCYFLHRSARSLLMQNSGPSPQVAASHSTQPPTILVGVTHPQTCLILGARVRTLREAGFRVLLVSGPGELLDSTAAHEGVERIAIPMQREISPLTDPIALFRLWLLLVRRRPDIVEFSTPKAGLLGSIAAMLCGVPHRVYMLRGLKCETASGLKRRILYGAERLASACAHVVLCNSESLREQAMSLGVAPGKKLRLLGEGSSNGVDIRHFSPGPSDVRQRLGIPRHAKVVGFVGRFTRDKGLPELLSAFQEIHRAEPCARLLLVGWFDAAEDALDKDLRTRILRDPHIDCTGFVSDTAPYYRAMDILVLPSWREGFPNAVLEAAATGVPVVTTECTGARDSVISEVTGLLVPPGYPEAISEAVLKIICDPARQLRMGRAALAWIHEHYLESRVLGLTADYYRRLVGMTQPLARAPESDRPH